MKIKINIVLLVTLASGCMSNFNLEDPVNSSFSVESLSDTEYLLTSTYNALYNSYLWGFETTETAADMAFPGGSYRYGVPDNETLSPFYYQSYSNSSSYIEYRFAAIYTGIFRANQVITGLNMLDYDNFSDSEIKTWTHRMCQARALRGMFHLFAHSVFNRGDVIMYDFLPSSLDQLTSPLAKAEDVQTFFRKDLQWAIDNWTDTTSKTGEFTQNAARTFLGMSYLYNEEWQEASDMLLPVIESGDYELVRDMSLLFSVAGEFNAESIFEINYENGVHDDLSSSDQSNTVNNFYSGAKSKYSYPSWLICAYQFEALNEKDPRNVVLDKDGTVEYYKTLSGVPYPLYTKGQVTDEDLIALAGITLDEGEIARYRTISLRGSASSIIAIDDDYQFYVTQPQVSLEFTLAPKSCLAYCRKFLNWDIYDTDNEVSYIPGGSGYSGKNIIIHRLAGVYLAYAEAQNELGNVDEALKYINRIRERWGLQLIGTAAKCGGEFTDEELYTYDEKTYDQIAVRAHIRDVERPLELAQEGYCTRFIDMRRWEAMDGYATNRYADLSQRVYSPGSFCPDGGSTDRQILVEHGTDLCEQYGGSSGGDIAQSGISYSEFESANKYFASNRAAGWMPIPLDEVQNNPNLEKNGVLVHF